MWSSWRNGTISIKADLMAINDRRENGQELASNTLDRLEKLQHGPRRKSEAAKILINWGARES
jgi:hypothetical protein